MATKTTRQSPRAMLEQAQRTLAQPLDTDAVLARIGSRDKGMFARRLAAVEATDPARARLWRHLAAVMFALAPEWPKVNQRAIQFYIPDGRYRMQVFALDDPATATLTICCEDLLKEAIDAGLLAAPKKNHARNQYLVAGTEQTLVIDRIDGKTENPAVYCKEMTGWNRRAMLIALPVDASKEQVRVVESLCAMAAQTWVANPAVAK